MLSSLFELMDVVA